jgi:mannosyltransferase
MAIYFVLLLALILRLIIIDQSFWLDEASQAMTSLRPLNEIIFNNLQDFHPPLSYIMTHFWIQFSKNEVWLRLLPVLFGIGTVYMLYLLGRKLFDEKVGLLAALLLALAPYHIYYSQEFRMYSMAAFFAIVSMYYFVTLLGDKGDKRDKGDRVFEDWNGMRLLRFARNKQSLRLRLDVTIFVMSSVALLYTHYLGGVLFLGQIVYLLIYERDLWRKFGWIYGVIGLLFLPWLPFLYQQLQLGVKADTVLPGWSSMLSLSAYKALPLLFTKFFIGRIDFVNNLIYGSIMLGCFVLIAFTTFPLVKKIKEKKVLLLLLWFWIPVLFTFFISFKVPMFQPFRLLFILPAFYLLIAYGIFQHKKFEKLLLRITVVSLLIFQGIFLANSNFWREDWKGAVTESDKFTKQSFSANKKSGSALFAWKESFPPYQFYSTAQVGVGGLMPEVEEQLIEGKIGGPIVYFSYLGQLTDPEKKTQKMLESYGYKQVDVKDFRGVGFLYFYSQKSFAYLPRESTLGMK